MPDTDFDQLQFTSDGSLTSETMSALYQLDASELGSAVTVLAGRVSSLQPAARASASEAVEGVVDDILASNYAIAFDVPGLVALYRTSSADPSKAVVTELVVRLLLNVDRDEVFASIPVTSAGLALRAELAAALDSALGVAMTNGDDHGNLRGIDFGPPPTPGPAGNGGGFKAEAMPEAFPEDLAADDGEMAEPPGGAQANGGGLEAKTARTPTYRAYGLLDCADRVAAGETFQLEVGLSEKQAIGVAGPPLEVPRPEDKEYDLDVQLFADGFDLGPGESWRHSLRVKTGDLYPTVVVHLTARDLADHLADRTITATYSIAGETLGVAMRAVRVVKDAAAVPAGLLEPQRASGTNITAPTGEPKAHVTITITKGLGDGVLQWGVVSDLPGVALPADKPTTTDIGKEPKAFALEIINELLLQGSAPGLFQLLEGIGKTVRDELPAAVQDALAAAAQAVAPDTLQVLILTEEPFIPWELATLDTPFNAAAPNFLGAQANVGRWILDPDHPTDPPRAKSVASMAVVWGVYTNNLARLEAAEKEAELLQAEFGATSVTAEPQPVTTLLDGTPAADVLHFAVHGKYSPQAAGDGIYLISGPPISPLRIRGANLATSAPFVFLNACQVGSANTLLGNYGGMAQAFLKAGASGVIAPLWSIDDKIAQEIALEFYRQALAGAPKAGKPESGAAQIPPPTVADLLREARVKLATNAKDRSATYLAYQFYGHPTMRLSWT